MSIRLRELIRNVRACKTQADERGCIHKECAAIRTAFKEESNELRHRNVAKLLFIHMLGYPTHWGQMECLKLIAGNKFLEKRIGYLGLMILLDERQEVLMLVENSLKNDLQSANQYISGLACCSIGNIASPEICRDLSPEVEKLMVGSNPFVSKKAALCAIRILRKCPELVDTFTERIGTLLGSRNHAVLLTSLKLMREARSGPCYPLPPPDKPLSPPPLSPPPLLATSFCHPTPPPHRFSRPPLPTSAKSRPINTNPPSPPPPLRHPPRELPPRAPPTVRPHSWSATC
jgi:hypothetical protein